MVLSTLILKINCTYMYIQYMYIHIHIWKHLYISIIFINITHTLYDVYFWRYCKISRPTWIFVIYLHKWLFLFIYSYKSTCVQISNNISLVRLRKPSSKLRPVWGDKEREKQRNGIKFRYATLSFIVWIKRDKYIV